MKAIFLYGHSLTVTAAYMQLDAMLRKHQARDIVLAMVAAVDEHTAHSLRQSGGELWRCAPEPTTETAAIAHAMASVLPDRDFLPASWHDLTSQVQVALQDFMAAGRVAA